MCASIGVPKGGNPNREIERLRLILMIPEESCEMGRSPTSRSKNCNTLNGWIGRRIYHDAPRVKHPKGPHPSRWNDSLPPLQPRSPPPAPLFKQPPQPPALSQESVSVSEPRLPPGR